VLECPGTLPWYAESVPWQDTAVRFAGLCLSQRCSNQMPSDAFTRVVLLQITQMKFRLSEGGGECFYYVGVEDAGYPRGLTDNDLRLSLNNLNYMASALKATATIARLFQGAAGRCCALVHVRRNCVEDVHYLEMRVAGETRAHSLACSTHAQSAIMWSGCGLLQIA
jgi:hypothetical protein